MFNLSLKIIKDCGTLRGPLEIPGGPPGPGWESLV